MHREPKHKVARRRCDAIKVSCHCGTEIPIVLLTIAVATMGSGSPLHEFICTNSVREIAMDEIEERSGIGCCPLVEISVDDGAVGERRLRRGTGDGQSRRFGLTSLGATHNTPGGCETRGVDDELIPGHEFLGDLYSFENVGSREA